MAKNDPTIYRMTSAHIRRGLKALARDDSDIRQALEVAGYPVSRPRPPGGFHTLMRIIVGQQLSVKAAATINGRLIAATRPRLTSNAFLRLSDEELRAIGLSGQKMRYGRLLSEAVRDRKFRPASLARMDDAAAIEAITALKGLGRWSAEMYLMFSLGRADIWPAGDLGVQEGIRRIKGLAERPGEKDMDAIAGSWSPHRSALSLLCWHYLDNAPEV